MIVLRKRYTVLIIILLLSVFSVAADQKVSDNMKKLLKGKILLDIIDKNDVDGIRLSFTVKASKNLIWEAIASNDLIDDIFKDCKKIEIEEENERDSVVTYHLNILFKKYVYTLIRRFEPEIYRTTWEKKSGDFKQISGFWEIHNTTEPGIFLVISESFLETGFAIPAWMSNLVKKTKTKEIARSLRKWIKKNPDYLVSL